MDDIQFVGMPVGECYKVLMKDAGGEVVESEEGEYSDAMDEMIENVVGEDDNVEIDEMDLDGGEVNSDSQGPGNVTRNGHFAPPSLCEVLQWPLEDMSLKGVKTANV